MTNKAAHITFPSSSAGAHVPTLRGGSRPEPRSSLWHAAGTASAGKTTQAAGSEALWAAPHNHELVARLGTGKVSSPKTLCPQCSPTTPRGGAGAACHSCVPLFPCSYSLEFLSSVCFVSALNEQEEKGRSLDKSDQGTDMLRPPPAGMPSPALMRGGGEAAAENSGPTETPGVRDRGKRSCWSRTTLAQALSLQKRVFPFPLARRPCSSAPVPVTGCPLD